MDEPRSLDDSERQAWKSLVTVVNVGIPQIERTFRQHGLVHIEYAVLAVLSDRPRGMRLCDLARTQNMSASRLSHRMRKLVHRGLVDISGSDADGRVSIAMITDSGRRLIRTIAPRHVRDVRRMLFEGLDPDQTVALADALATVAGHLTGRVGTRYPVSARPVAVVGA